MCPRVLAEPRFKNRRTGDAPRVRTPATKSRDPVRSGIGGATPSVVRLEIPASLDYIRMARLVVGALASQLDFTIDDSEDLAIAVDELCFLLIGRDGWDGTIEVSCCIDGGEVCVEGTARDVGQSIEPSPFSTMILRAVANSFNVWREADEVHFRLVAPHRTPWTPDA
jgi:hypothetical protein